MQIIEPIASVYAERFTTPMPPALQEVEQSTISGHPLAHMLSGTVQGRLLEMWSRMIAPRRILEVGTFTGYSAICLAKGLQEQGMLHTIELRPEDAATAQQNIDNNNLQHCITLHIGDAATIIPALEEEWDMVFIDADKVNYITYYELTLPRLKPGGWLIADNVLFHGEVLETTITGKNAKAIHAFNEHVANDTRVEQVLLTVRDGLMLVRKR
jgi:caffeoyl-CoA O-methyltransferase